MVHLQEFSYTALEIEPTARKNLIPLNFPSLLETNYRSSFTSHLSQRKSSSSSSQRALLTPAVIYIVQWFYTWPLSSRMFPSAPIPPQDEPSPLTGRLNTICPEQNSHLLTSVIAPTLYRLSYFISFHPSQIITLILIELSDESHLSLGWPDPATMWFPSTVQRNLIGQQ